MARLSTTELLNINSVRESRRLEAKIGMGVEELTIVFRRAIPGCGAGHVKRRNGNCDQSAQRPEKWTQPRAGAGEAAPNPTGLGLAMVSTSNAARMQSAPATKKAGR
jgi:hypothetical protein